MAKKNTYAAMMKQLSGKKAKYEKGLAEANRTGNRSGIADYNRRLQQLSAGMDELFDAQEAGKQKKMYGGKTKYNDGGFTAKQYQDYLDHKRYNRKQGYGEIVTNPHLKAMVPLFEAAMAAGIDPLQGWDGTSTGTFGTKYEQETIDNPNLVVEDAGFTASEYTRYKNFEKARKTGKGIFKPEELNAMSALGQKIYAAEQMGIDPSKGFDGIPRDNRNDTQRLADQRQAEADKVIDSTAGKDNPYSDITNSDRVTAVPYDGTPGAYVRDGKMFVNSVRAGGTNILTEPQLKDWKNNGLNTYLENLNQGVYGARRQSDVNPSQGVMTGGVQTSGDNTPGAPGVDANGNQVLDTVTITPGPTPAPAPAPQTGGGSGSGTAATPQRPEFTPIEPIDILGPERILNTAKGDAYYQVDGSPRGLQVDITRDAQLARQAAMEPTIPTKTTRMREFRDKIGDGFRANPQAIGMLAGGLAQMLPTMASMKQMKNLEGPVDMPMQRVQAMNTDIQVGKQMQQIKDAEARSAAAIAANVSNPVVAAAMRRAGQQATQKSMANLLGNEATQEAQMRNQNLRMMTDTINQNAMIQAQNQQRGVDFENDRIASLNRMRQSMGQTLGGMYTDFQRAALDRERLKYMREAYDPYNLGATDEERNQ